MFKEARPSKVLLYQSVGFLAIIALCMLDELIGLSSLLLGNQPYISDFRQSILKGPAHFWRMAYRGRFDAPRPGHMQYLKNS